MAGHGSAPAEDKANHPNRQVGRIMSNVASTQPRAMGKTDKSHPIPLMIQRMRRERPGVAGGEPVSRQTPPAVWQKNIG
jgi:hypothetical protein